MNFTIWLSPSLRYSQFLTVLPIKTASFQLLNSERFPRLWKLKLSIPYVNTSRSKEEKSLEIFQDFNPTIVQLASDTIELQCCLSNSQSYCRVALFTDSVEIKYAKDAAAIEVEPKPRIRRIPSFRRMWESLWSMFFLS